MKLAKKEGREWNEEEYQQSLQKKDFGGRPDDAKIAGKEPVAAADTTATNGQGRIKVGSKEEADRLLAEGKTKPCIITTSNMDFMQQSGMPQMPGFEPKVLRADDYPTWTHRRRALIKLLIEIGKEPEPEMPAWGGF